MSTNTLILFVKYPEPGKVKTRLAREVGFEQAAEIYRKLVEANLKVLSKIEKRFRLILAFDPIEKEREIRGWLEPFQIDEYFPQRGVDLGGRLQNAFTFAFGRKPKQFRDRKVMALGSDTLGLTPQIITEGFEALKSYDCVIGPAVDGGYYLIGLASGNFKIFSNVPWSTAVVYQSTIQYLAREQMTYHELPELEDLDTAKNLKEELL